MQAPPIPQNEAARLETLAEYQAVRQLGADSFDDITQLAAEVCRTPIALISIVESERQCFSYRVGLDVEETSREVSFCSHVLTGEDFLEVEDALEDPRFADNPLVTGFPNIRFYAGAPLTTPNGHVLGTLCVIDSKPGKLDTNQRRLLQILARDFVGRLDKVRTDIELKASQSLQSLICNTNEDLIFVKDEEFRIVYGNKAFLAVYPEDMQDQIIGFTTVEGFHEHEREKFLENDRLTFRDGIHQIDETVSLPNGHRKILDTTKKRFDSADGKAMLLGISRDVTSQRLLVSDLEKSNADLKNFAYVASHDLKAPLNAVKGLIEWVLEDCEALLPEKSSEHLGLALGRVARMQRLLADLLSYSRVGSDNHDSVELSLSELIQELRPLLDLPESISLSSEPFTLQAPRVALETCLLNLISNSIKHCKKADCRITVSGRLETEFFVVEVADNGPGIPERFQTKIFELFHTLQSRDTLETSGMGLSIVKRLIERYRGSIAIESDGSSGSTFIMRWPREPLSLN